MTNVEQSAGSSLRLDSAPFDSVPELQRTSQNCIEYLREMFLLPFPKIQDFFHVHQIPISLHNNLKNINMSFSHNLPTHFYPKDTD